MAERNERPDLREQADVEPRTRRDMREADQAGDAGRETVAGRTARGVARKIRDLRRTVARRKVEKQSRELQKKRDRRKRREPIREAKKEARRLKETASGGLLGRAVGAVSGLGAGTDVGARGQPGIREDDPAARAGEVAKTNAPIDATLDPFGGPNRPEGPMQLMLMAGGGPVEVREARRREQGLTHLQEFAAGGGMVYDDVGRSAGADPLVVQGDPLDVDPNPLFGGGER